MPVVDLMNPRAKIVRGFIHLDALMDEIGEFAARTSDPIINWEQRVVREDGQDWNAIVCTEVLQKPPAELGLVFGDTIHNFRTALDHLVCSLVEANGKTPTRSNQFPIQVRTPDETAKKRIRRNLAKLDPVARKRIKSIQPYLDPGADWSEALAALSLMDNDDKHQLVAPAVGLSDGTGINIEPRPTEPPRFITFNYNTPIFPGTTILRWPLNDPRVISLTIDNFSASVGFGGAKTGITMRGLPYIGQMVFDIVESFEGFRPV